MKVLQKYYLHNQKCKWNHGPQHSQTTEKSLAHREEWGPTPDTWLDLKMMTEARHTSPHSVRVHLYKISTEAEHRQGVTGAGKGFFVGIPGVENRQERRAAQVSARHTAEEHFQTVPLSV